MLVKVRSRKTKNVITITQKNYSMNKGKYEYLGPAEKDADLAEYQEKLVTTTASQTQAATVTIPNQSTTANQNSQPGEEGAEAVEANEAPKKRGPKPKNQISSATANAEV